MAKTFAKSATPEVIALQALGFLAGEPELLAGVLDHVLGDESLLFLFCEAAGLDPAAPRAARRGLPGAAVAD